MSSSPLARTSVRRLGAAALTAVAVTGLSLRPPPPLPPPPGDSGEINIHKPGTPNSDPRDEVKICRFNLAAVNFETVPLVNITVTPQ